MTTAEVTLTFRQGHKAEYIMDGDELQQLLKDLEQGGTDPAVNVYTALEKSSRAVGTPFSYATDGKRIPGTRQYVAEIPPEFKPKQFAVRLSEVVLVTWK